MKKQSFKISVSALGVILAIILASLSPTAFAASKSSSDSSQKNRKDGISIEVPKGWREEDPLLLITKNYLDVQYDRKYSLDIINTLAVGSADLTKTDKYSILSAEADYFDTDYNYTSVKYRFENTKKESEIVTIGDRRFIAVDISLFNRVYIYVENAYVYQFDLWIIDDLNKNYTFESVDRQIRKMLENAEFSPSEKKPYDSNTDLGAHLYSSYNTTSYPFFFISGIKISLFSEPK